MNQLMRIIASTTLLAFAGQALAATAPKWTWEAGKQSSNGSITLKSTSGSTTYNGTQNPSGAVAKTNQVAVTQPPTVIVQATSSLAVHAVGDACTASTSGTAPNQNADEGIAITLDRTSILSCQSGVYKTAGAASNVMYGGSWGMYYGPGWNACYGQNAFYGNACACPPGYSAFFVSQWTDSNGSQMKWYDCYKLNFL